MMKKDIYIIKNDINDKIYVGQSVNAFDRFSKHISEALHGKDNMLIHKAIKKYGREHFTCVILESQIENYDEREQYWIKKLDTLTPNGYNIAIGGQGTGNGINSVNSLIKSEDVLNQIREKLKEDTMSMAKIAEMFNVTQAVITGINTGTYYFDSEIQYPIRESKKYSEEKCKQLVYSLRYELDKSIAQIAQEYQIDYSQLLEINQGKIHRMEWIKDYPIRKSKEVRVIEVVDNIIDDLLNSTLKQKEIAAKYNVSAMTVSYINTGKKHRRENLNYPLRGQQVKGGFTCLSPDLVQTIRKELAETNRSMNLIGEEYEVPPRTVAGINDGSIKKYRDNNLEYPIRKK